MCHCDLQPASLISKDLSVTERKMTVEYHHEIESGETTMYQVEKISVES